MALKGRNDLTSVIESNVYPNNEKAITAEMLQTVLHDFKDSMFNLLDDKLKNAIYEDNNTLEQHLAGIVGALPEQGTILDVDIAGGSTGENNPLNVDNGAIESAYLITKTNDDSLIKIIFKKSNANRLIIPVLKFSTGVNWNYANDVSVPVIRRTASNSIELAIRELSDRNQHLNIQLIIL